MRALRTARALSARVRCAVARAVLRRAGEGEREALWERARGGGDGAGCQPSASVRPQCSSCRSLSLTLSRSPSAPLPLELLPSCVPACTACSGVRRLVSPPQRRPPVVIKPGGGPSSGGTPDQQELQAMDAFVSTMRPAPPPCVSFPQRPAPRRGARAPCRGTTRWGWRGLKRSGGMT